MGMVLAWGYFVSYEVHTNWGTQFLFFFFIHILFFFPLPWHSHPLRFRINLFHITHTNRTSAALATPAHTQNVSLTSMFFVGLFNYNFFLLNGLGKCLTSLMCRACVSACTCLYCWFIAVSLFLTKSTKLLCKKEFSNLLLPIFSQVVENRDSFFCSQQNTKMGWSLSVLKSYYL